VRVKAKEVDYLLDIRNLKVTFPARDKSVRAVDGLSLTLRRGEIYGLIGESGSGKSVTGLSIMRLLDAYARIEADWIKLMGQDLLLLTEAEMRKIRGNKISIIFQDPMTSLNPSMTVGKQIEESLTVHQGMRVQTARMKAYEMMEMVAIPDPKTSSKRFPHEFSGGMRQRVMISMALCCNPHLLIADEPTTALDVTVQAQILELLKTLVLKLQTSVLLITHDFGVVAELCDGVSVIYGGEIVEHAPTQALLNDPRHPYTIGLRDCIILPNKENSELEVIPGAPPDPKHFPAGCKFHPRCKLAREKCSREIPDFQQLNGNHFVRCFAAREVWN
jgi:peptide/nickel transport system ATP-binding protein